MTLRPSRFSAISSFVTSGVFTRAAALALVSGLVTVGAQAQAHPSDSAPQSAYGGQVVEQAIARVNDQVISSSDYERAQKEMDDAARQRGESLQQIADGHKDLLRNLIDQQLWLSKGKELGITGDDELIKQLDDIRKKYNLATIDDLEKAAKEQGVSFEDFKQNIRNQIITQDVMREEIGHKVQITPGEAQRYYEAHKAEYQQPESVHLAEILVSAGGAEGTDDPQKVAAAKAKADDIEAKLKAGDSFDTIARAQSDGPTAAEGGDLGKWQRGGLNKVFEDATFGLKAGEYTAPIRTRQGYVIFKVVEHNTGGAAPYKDVEPQVEEALFESRMEPAIRSYLTEMREEAYIDIKPGYVDAGASPKETKPVYSAYTPPAPKKKHKAQRVRFRETERGFRNKNKASVVDVSADTTPAKPAVNSTAKASKAAKPVSEKPGKREKIRFGQAPRETLPNATETKVEDAGALPKDQVDATTAEITNPLDQAPPEKKTRFRDRAKLPKEKKPQGPQLDSFTPAPPDSQEVADRQTQSAPLGLNGDTAKKKKKHQTSNGQKTRMQERPKDETQKQAPELTPAAPVAGAPAPAKPTPAPESTTPQSTTPQSTTPQGTSPQ
ncbi:peptidylprolyl isomerase [Acidicapsa dinghuensis]|uniref:peptidylprolyl isomerase n=1 Tax=Acidicapsa dinghuensis TaxID=2218256 RepID=A0ABW1EMF8_9BACT|nr:peptidylprolyl isomerase [Acidicapsa dinghuensis]